MLSDIHERRNAKIKEITAKSELESEKILAEAKEISNKVLAEGIAQAESVRTQTMAYCKMKEAEMDANVSIKLVRI